MSKALSASRLIGHQCLQIAWSSRPLRHAAESKILHCLILPTCCNKYYLPTDKHPHSGEQEEQHLGAYVIDCLSLCLVLPTDGRK